VLAAGVVVAGGCSGRKSKTEDSAPATAVEGRKPSSRPALKEKYAYLRPAVCGNCHAEHLRQWQHSLMALSHIEPVYNFYFIKASQDSGKKLEPFCGRCHTPIAVMNSTIPFKHPLHKPGDTKVGRVESTGVQCDFCHTITGYTKLFNAGFTAVPSRTKRGPYRDSSSKFHDTAYSALHTSAELCGICHNVNHPVNGIVLESTYTEWKESPYARQGITCQKCHLTDGLTEPRVHPGKAALNGPKRKHVSRHYFVGPNILFANRPGAGKLKALSLKLLKSAAKVELLDPVRRRGKVEIRVKITNVGAGHYLPTGITEIREMWLEVKVTDSKGRVLFERSGLDTKGNLKLGPHSFKTWVYDKKGRATTQFWNTVRKGQDNRIAPKKSTMHRYGLSSKGLGRGPVTVTAKLKYRSVSPAGLKEVGAPPDLVKIPVITMASATKTF
jgi:hypothetical protein